MMDWIIGMLRMGLYGMVVFIVALAVSWALDQRKGK